MNRPTVAAATIAVAAATIIAAAPPAQAYAVASTVVTFGGTNCISHRGAMIANPWLLSDPTTSCSTSGTLTWSETRPAGAWIGVDPAMGAADWIACTIYDGWRTYHDFAARGDGTDVNCLRTAL